VEEIKGNTKKEKVNTKGAKVGSNSEILGIDTGGDRVRVLKQRRKNCWQFREFCTKT